MTTLNMGLFKKSSNLRQSDFSNELKWRLSLEYSGIGVWEYDAILDRVFFSEESKKIIGNTDPNFGMDSQAWNVLVHPDDKEKYFNDFLEHLSGIKPMYENEHRIKCADGSYKWILDKGKVVERTRDGKAKRIIGTHTDITKQKDAENKAIKALNLATKQSNQLKNFAHIVTHNLKQHAGNFESLLGFYDESETINEKEELVDHLKSLSTSLTKTISNLNNIVSVQANKNMGSKKIFIYNEIDNVLKMLNILISNTNTTVNNNIDEALFINYNESYFESVVQNLITNAIKYKHPDRDPVIDLDYTLENDNLQLKISDNGIGIDLDKFGDSVFGLYKTFHRNEDSEGVGLYLIKNQIESFGGKIDVDSIVNVGTEFTITIPNIKKV